MSSKNKVWINYLLDYGIVIVLFAILAIFSISSGKFFSVTTAIVIMRQVAITGVIAVGMTFVMITGGIDLSVGAVAGVAGVLAAVLMLAGVPVVGACAVSVLVGALFGFFNGISVCALNIPPLIGTLGMMTTLRGIAYLLSGGIPVYGFDKNFKYLAQGSLMRVPYPVLIMLFVCLIGWIVLTKTPIGRYIYGVGGNEEASRLSGINVRGVKYFVYIVSGFLSGLAGLLLLARTNSGQPSAGSGYEMDAITAVVLGGVSISGGSGNVWLVSVGVVIMGTLSTGMVMNSINDYVQQVIKGLVLIAAVAFAQYSQKVKARNV